MNTDDQNLRVVRANSLADVTVADHAWDLYARLLSCKDLVTKANKPFLTLQLGDQGGTIEAKIWSDAKLAMEAARQLEPQSIVKVRGQMRDYQGQKQLIIERIKALDPGEDADFDRSQLTDPALELVEDLVCKTLVIDIETVPGFEHDRLPESVADALEQFAQRKEPASSADVLQARIGMSMGLSPLFGKVVSIALGDGDEPDADVHVIAVPPNGFVSEGHPSWLRFMTEADLLRSFWALASKAEVVVTFNGKSFDLPFLVGRSLVHGIPARCDLVSQKWTLKPHLDLFELLSQRDKAPSKLDVICWALGVESPKGDMDGSKVAPAYARGEIVKIAEYNRQDVRATAEVFRKVRDNVLRFRADWK